MSCGTALEARRNSDERWTFTPSSKRYTFSGMAPLFTVRRGETVLLQIDQTQTVNGSLFSVVGDSVVLQLKKGDAALLDGPTPDTNAEALFYDVTLTDQTGFENWIVGGPFTLLGLNDASCSGCNEKVEVTIGGQCIQINIEGGNTGIGASVNLAALNQAVQDAETAAGEAAQSAADAATAGATAGAAAGETAGTIAGEDAGTVAGTAAANAVVATKANKAGDTFTGTIKSDLQNLSPAQYPGIDGSLGTSASFDDIRRTGGFGAYGHDLTTVLVTAILGDNQIDAGKTAWVTMQKMASGAIGAFGGWSGANSPSSSLGGQTFSGGSIIGHEFNVGNRWGDLGLQTALTGHDLVGAQFVADVVPAADGTTAAIYPGTFAFAVSKSIHGHKWWTGPFVATDAVMPGGYANLTSGGSTSGNAPQTAHKFQGNFIDGIDFSSAVFASNGRELKWADVSINRGTTPGRLLFRGLGDIPLLNVASTASATAYLEIRNQVGSAEFTAQSLTLTDVPLKLAAKGAGPLDLYYGPTLAARFQPAASGETSLWLLDGTTNTLKRVTVGAADSGGAGFRVLRVAN